MIRFFLLLSLCLSAFGQLSKSPEIVATYAELAARVPTSRIIMMGATNGSIVFAYFADATDATNASTTSPIIKPINANGRWFGMKIGSGATGALLASNNLSDLASASTARDNINGGAETAYGTAWDAQSQFASRNAVYDKVESLYVDSIQAMRNLDTTTLNRRYVKVGGYYTKGDGGGGDFYWASTDTTATNLGTAFQDAALTSSGRWLRLFPNYVNLNVRWFGAKGDGATDDNAAFNSAEGVAGAGKANLYVPFGNYRMASVWTINTSNIRIIGEPGARIYYDGTPGITFIVIAADNVVFKGLEVDASELAQVGVWVDNGSSGSDDVEVSENIIHNTMANDANDASAGGTSAGVLVRRATDRTRIFKNLIYDIEHVTSGTNRVSGGIVFVDVGWTTSADNITASSANDNIIHTIGVGKEGAGIRVSTQTGTGRYDSGIVLSRNIIYNCGKREIKIIGDGVTIQGGTLTSTDSFKYSAISLYGANHIVNGVKIVGTYPDKIIEVGTTASGEESMNINLSGLNITGTGAGDAFRIRANSHGVNIVNAVVNNVARGIYTEGMVSGVLVSGFNLTNATGNGIQFTTDGSNSPFDSQVYNVNIKGAAAGVVLTSGTNINVGMIKGSVTGSLFSRAGGVTGTEVLETTAIDDTAYNATTWDSDTTHAPSKNAVRDKIETLVAASGDVTAASSFGTDNRAIRSDGTGKGVQSSAVTIDDSGNISTAGTITGDSFTGTGTTANSRVDVPDDDASAYAGFQANDTTTTSVNMVFPAAPFAGIVKTSVNATTNWPFAQAVADTDYVAPGGNIAAGTATTASANDNTTKIATTAYVQAELTAYASDTVAFTGKTLDAAATGNILKLTDYKDFIYPHKVDGSGATITTNDYTSGLSGLATYNGTADTNANYAFFRIGTVPADLDTSVAMTLKGFSIRVSATDTDAAEFTIALFSPASSAAYTPSDFTACSTFINFDSGTLTSPAANDVFYFSDVTLTGWAAALTAGRPFVIGIARRNGSNDDSVTVLGGTITYGRTQ